MLFCATKSVKPFKSYDHSKIGKGEKEHKNMKNLIFTHVNMSLTLFLVFFLLLIFTMLSRVLPCQLKQPDLSEKSPKSGKNGQNREMTTFLKQIIVMFVFTCSYTLIKPQQRGNRWKENSSEVILAQCRPKSGQN